MRIHTHKYKSIDVILAAALFWAAFATRIPAEPKLEDPNLTLPVCIGIVVIVVGGVIVYKLANFCDSRFPRTNTIPRSSNTAHIVMQETAGMGEWTTVFETNCFLDEFQYQPETTLPHRFYRAMFP